MLIFLVVISSRKEVDVLKCDTIQFRMFGREPVAKAICVLFADVVVFEVCLGVFRKVETIVVVVCCWKLLSVVLFVVAAFQIIQS